MNPDVDERILHALLSRRRFLEAAAAAFVAAACSDDEGGGGRAIGTTAATATSSSTTTVPSVRLPSDPFTLGVASGDPADDGVVLWTRLAPEPLDGGGMPIEDVPVIWEVADDDRFTTVVQSGIVTATPAFAHAVHVEVDGLDADRWYSYRFRVGDYERTGRTRTLPAPSARKERLGFAFASCQHYQSGFYTAHRELAAEDLDLVLFLGDYIYEGGVDADGVRQHNGPAVTTLDAYRARYGLYNSDPDLQSAHAAFPWIVVWDDHEVVNNYAGAEPRGGETVEAFLGRRAAAYQAWYEHQPVRLGPPAGADLPIFRSFAFGDLAELFALDTRQYRSLQACGQPSDVGTGCPEVGQEERTLLGAEQEGWLLDGLGRVGARWHVLAQQVVMAATPVPVGGQAFLNLDQWDGYPAQRRRLLGGIAERGVTNAVVVTGDIHASGVADLRVDFDDESSPVVASELVGTSISSDFPEGFIDLVESSASAAPHVHWYDARHRGYVRCEVTPDALRADYRLLDDARRPDATITTARSWVIDDGRPGVTEA